MILQVTDSNDYITHSAYTVHRRTLCHT